MKKSHLISRARETKASQDQIPPNKPQKKRHIGPKEHLKDVFIEAYKKAGVIGEACEMVGVKYRTIYDWRHKDPAFAEKFNTAFIRWTERLEKSAMVRAVVGVEKPVFFKDQVVGHTREYSDYLTKFLLEVRDPKRFGAKIRHEIDVKIIQKISAGFIGVIRKVIPEYCPSCHAHLNLPKKVAEEMKYLTQASEIVTDENKENRSQS